MPPLVTAALLREVTADLPRSDVDPVRVEVDRLPADLPEVVPRELVDLLVERELVFLAMLFLFCYSFSERPELFCEHSRPRHVCCAKPP